MKGFTEKVKGYEKTPVYVALKEFFDSFLIEKNYNKMLSLLTDDFAGVGTVEENLVTDKKEFIRSLEAELSAAAGVVEYKINSVSGKAITEDVWNVMATLEIDVVSGFEQENGHFMHMTGCFKREDEGFKIDALHLSKTTQGIIKTKSDKIAYDIISKSMPGGIVIGYAQEGYPLCFANDRYLELLGYKTYEEYYKDAGGSGMCHIHPDDTDMVNKQIEESYSTDTQFGIEYRIRRKDGQYIHVYDIGKKMLLPGDKEVIICVLYDMTEEVRMKEILVHDSSYDALTGIYNRGGGIKAIINSLENAKQYSFMFFDVDNLKLLNDKYSHEAGDRALQFFSELLMKYFSDKTILVRMGGDEFVAFIDESLNMQRLQRIYTILEQEYCNYVDDTYPESHSSVSIGCVIGDKKYNFDELYRIADELMYDIKKHGKRGYKIIELNQ